MKLINTPCVCSCSVEAGRIQRLPFASAPFNISTYLRFDIIKWYLTCFQASLATTQKAAWWLTISLQFDLPFSRTGEKGEDDLFNICVNFKSCVRHYSRRCCANQIIGLKCIQGIRYLRNLATCFTLIVN